MSEVKKCEHGSEITLQLFETLDFNEEGIGRHKCVICAYSIGLKDGQDKLIDFNNNDDIEICKHNRKAIKSKIQAISINHKPTEGRHKCAVCAYHFGYEKGMGEWEDNFDAYNEDELTDTEEIYNITQFGTSSDIVTIYNRLEKGKYYVPSFQRDYVWDNKKASKLIESIIMGLPIPAIFLAKDGERYYIVDGQQRLTSIQRYYKNEFALKDTFSAVNGKKYTELEERHKDRLDEYSLQLIMIRQETPDDNDDSIYKIFERINTQGTKLLPQEIRTASYNGDFQIELSKYAEDKRWINFIKTKNTRKTHEELILRFFALFFDIDNYKAPMKHFLNIYMSKNRNLKLQNKDTLDNIFNRTLTIIANNLIKEDICLKGSNRVNTQLLDSILVGIAHNIDYLEEKKGDFLITKINELKSNIANEEYKFSYFWESRASQSENVKGRCDITIKLFGK
jgi:hypothetical protein